MFNFQFFIIYNIMDKDSLKIRIPTPKVNNDIFDDDQDNKIKKYSLFKYLICCMCCYLK